MRRWICAGPLAYFSFREFPAKCIHGKVHIGRILTSTARHGPPHPLTEGGKYRADQSHSTDWKDWVQGHPVKPTQALTHLSVWDKSVFSKERQVSNAKLHWLAWPTVAPVSAAITSTVTNHHSWPSIKTLLKLYHTKLSTQSSISIK